MNPPEPTRSIIGFRTALIIYLLLVVFAVAALTGMARVIALVIVGGIAAKAYVHHLRRRME